MKKYTLLVIALFSICFLTACPAPEYNQVIINYSKTSLEVEYEYLFVKSQDFSEFNPAKMTLEQYEKEERSYQWNDLTAENEYKFEIRDEKSAGDEQGTDSNASPQNALAIKKVMLKLLPGEVLRVFYSKRFLVEARLFLSVKLRGENGKMEAQGDGVQLFSPYRPNGLFSDTKDLRIVYR